MAVVLKTTVVQATGGSNPSPSARVSTKSLVDISSVCRLGLQGQQYNGGRSHSPVECARLLSG